MKRKQVKLEGPPFSLANRRKVLAKGEYVGELWVSADRHNWNGGNAGYSFTANEHGRALGYSAFVAAGTVREALAKLERQAKGMR